jgi:hypothetical protein
MVSNSVLLLDSVTSSSSTVLRWGILRRLASILKTTAPPAAVI